MAAVVLLAAAVQGVYYGGLPSAVQLVRAGLAAPEDFCLMLGMTGARLHAQYYAQYYAHELRAHERMCCLRSARAVSAHLHSCCCTVHRRPLLLLLLALPQAGRPASCSTSATPAPGWWRPLGGASCYRRARSWSASCQRACGGRCASAWRASTRPDATRRTVLQFLIFFLIGVA